MSTKARRIRRLGVAFLGLIVLPALGQVLEDKEWGAKKADYFGSAVSMYGDRILIGAPGADNPTYGDIGMAYTYTRSGVTWNYESTLSHFAGKGGSAFGYSVDLGESHAIVGAIGDDGNTGSAVIFFHSGAWGEIERVTASDRAAGDLFGRGVAITEDGAVAVVGAPNHGGKGAIYIYEQSGISWPEYVNYSGATAGDSFGFSVAVEEDLIVVGAPGVSTGKGAAYVYERQTSGWARTNTITASDGWMGDNFGFSVAIDGDFIVVGAHQDDDGGSASGSAYVYERNPSTRMVTQRAKLLASDGATGDEFGSSVAIDGEWIIVGAQLHEHGGTKPDSGAAYIFEPSGATWVETGEIRDTLRAKEDNFGWGVDVWGDRFLVGVRGDDGIPKKARKDCGSACIFK